MKKRTVLVILAISTLVLTACLGVWLTAITTGGTRLLSIDGATAVGVNCLAANNKVRSGVTFKLFSTWLSQKELVGVITDYAGDGYYPISSYTKSIEMLPGEQQTYNLFIAEARVQRAISLSYTPDLATRIKIITSLTLCPP